MHKVPGLEHIKTSAKSLQAFVARNVESSKFFSNLCKHLLLRNLNVYACGLSLARINLIHRFDRSRWPLIWFGMRLQGESALHI